MRVQQMGSIVDKSGTEVVYHVVQSINRSEWPANTVKGMKREETATCYLYRQDLNGLVRCFVWGEIYDLSPLTQRVAEYVIAGIWLKMTRSVKCAQAKRLSLLVAMSAKRSSDVASSECSLCSRHVGIFGSSHVECAGCCEVRLHRQSSAISCAGGSNARSLCSRPSVRAAHSSAPFSASTSAPRSARSDASARRA